jgi:integrase
LIKPIIDDAWAGWHEFRRGLATSWYYLETEAKMVRAILCHANVSTTMAHYVIADPAEQRVAMSKLDGFWTPYEL